MCVCAVVVSFSFLWFVCFLFVCCFPYILFKHTVVCVVSVSQTSACDLMTCVSPRYDRRGSLGVGMQG